MSRPKPGQGGAHSEGISASGYLCREESRGLSVGPELGANWAEALQSPTTLTTHHGQSPELGRKPRDNDGRRPLQGGRWTRRSTIPSSFIGGNFWIVLFRFRKLMNPTHLTDREWWVIIYLFKSMSSFVHFLYSRNHGRIVWHKQKIGNLGKVISYSFIVVALTC